MQDVYALWMDEWVSSNTMCVWGWKRGSREEEEIRDWRWREQETEIEEKEITSGWREERKWGDEEKKQRCQSAVRLVLLSFLLLLLPSPSPSPRADYLIDRFPSHSLHPNPPPPVLLWNWLTADRDDWSQFQSLFSLPSHFRKRTTLETNFGNHEERRRKWTKSWKRQTFWKVKSFFLLKVESSSQLFIPFFQ